MWEKIGVAAYIVYILVGIIQFIAAIKGIQIWLGLPWLLAAFISMIVAYIPIVGTIAGIKGATDGWGWGFWPAVAFFCWPFVLYGLAILGAGAVDAAQRRDR